jgi:hypothetical protein
MPEPILLCVSYPNNNYFKIMNPESRVLDITAGNELDTLQYGLEDCNTMEQHPFSLKSRNACEIFSSWPPLPLPINLILTPI